MPTDGPLSFDFSDAPGGDLSLDDIFNIGDTNPTTNTTPVVQTQQTEEPQTFLKTSTGTVYNSADDAVKGIEHKDALIAQLRQQLSEQTGRDPIKVAKVEEPQRVSYLDDPKKYLDDIRNAKTEQEVVAVQSRFINENTERIIGPYAPLMAQVARNNAIDSVASDIPNVHEFLRSEEYKQTLEQFPLLKRSIEMSESNPQVSGDLSQLYRMAFNATTGRNLPKIVQTSTARTVSEARPTVSSTTPLAPNGNASTAPSLETSAGRKSIMEQQVNKGVLDLRF